ncbi:MAG: TolC family protein [Acidobacteria bacterium]|nr:TolC family protein [Acidobacteriota bacterium]
MRNRSEQQPWSPAARPRERTAVVRGARAGVLAILLGGLAGCVPAPAALRGPDPVPAAPARLVAAPPVPPPPAPRPAREPIPAALLAPGAQLALPQIIDIALSNNPATRETWLRARAAREELGSRRAAYYPEADLQLNASRTSQSALGGRFEILQNAYGPSLALRYLLLDFGGRRADVEEARQLLFAADWTHNAVVQNVILDVYEAYYGYLNARALRAAAESSLGEARTNLDAAQARHDAGVATIADVLQARTALSRAELTFQQVDGQIQVLLGALATAMGLPATTSLDVGELPEGAPVEAADNAVDELIAEATAARPDLAAARARALADWQHLAAVRAARRPTIDVTGSASRTYFDPATEADYGDNWSVQLALRWPLFTGGRQAHDARRAQFEAEASSAVAQDFEQQVVLQVWTSYYNVKTAQRQVVTSRDLLASATQNHEVALGRYKEGVGTVLDLLTAQAALTGARAQEIQSRSTWLVSLAQLLHDTGMLLPVEGSAP